VSENVLDEISLHPAFADPALESMNFLNEVMKRYPKAISFAPGAPNLLFQKEFDYNRSIGTFLEHVRKTRNWSKEQATSLLYEYGPAQGLICDLIADALKSAVGLQIHREDILITVGAQEAMFLALRALFRRPQDQLAVVAPCYVGIRGAASLLNIDLVQVNEAADGLDLDELKQRIAESRRAGKAIRAIYISPDYANPSGIVTSLYKRTSLLELAERENFYIIEDSAYGFTAARGKAMPSLKALDRAKRVLFIGTFAKICLPGARVGFVVADQPVGDGQGNGRSLARAMASAKSMITVNTSPICQAIIGGMLLEHEGSLESLGRVKSDFYRRNLSHLLEALARDIDPSLATWNRPSGGFFVLVNLPVMADTRLLEISASDFGVLWTPMSQFYLDGTGSNQLRLSCSYLTPDQIDDGIRRLSHFLTTLPQSCPQNASDTSGLEARRDKTEIRNEC